MSTAGLQQQQLQPAFSEGTDAVQVKTELKALLVPAGRWQLSHDAKGVERRFKFKTFKKTWVCDQKCYLPFE
jgi:pterin-4a-carbinolamine dehydratase